MNKMNFKTYMRMLQIVEFIIYFAVASILLWVVMPYVGLHVAVNVLFTMVALVGTFGILSNAKRKIVGKEVINRSYRFYDTLDTSGIAGMGDYFLMKSKISRSATALDSNIFMAYAFHDYTDGEPFEYIQNIMDVEEAYDDFFYYRVIQIREIMIFRFIQNGQIDKALEYSKKQLHYIEQSIDEEQVPEELIDPVLYISSTYRHLIRFINSPNVRTAFAIKIADDATNYDAVKTYYLIAKIFEENRMKKEVKITKEKVSEINGNYRLLERLKDY